MAPNKLDFIATEQVVGAGATVFWSLGGEAVSAEALTQALDDNNAGGCVAPMTPTPAIALRRALQALAEKRQLVRPLEHRGAYALVTEVVRGERITHEQRGVAKLDVAGRLVIECNSYKDEQAVRDEFDAALELLSHQDVSAWLCGTVSKLCDGVALRDTGGFYYVPPHKLGLWRRITEALTSVSSHRVYEMPTLKSEQAVRAILDALEADATGEAAAIRDSLLAGKLGDRACEARAQAVKLLEDKVGRYEQLLGVKLDSFKQSLETLRGALAIGAMQNDQLAGLAGLFGGE